MTDNINNSDIFNAILRLENKVSNVEGKIETYNDRFKTHYARMDKLEVDIDTTKEKLDKTHTRVYGILAAASAVWAFIVYLGNRLL